MTLIKFPRSRGYRQSVSWLLCRISNKKGALSNRTNAFASGKLVISSRAHAFESQRSHRVCVSVEKTVAAKSQSFNETTQRYEGYQVRQCCVTKVWRYRSDSIISRNTRPRNFKSKGSGCINKGYAPDIRPRCPNEFPRLVAGCNRASVCAADYRYRDSPNVMFGILMDSDYFACASDASDAESEKLKCISGLPVILPIRLRMRKETPHCDCSRTSFKRILFRSARSRIQQSDGDYKDEFNHTSIDGATRFVNFPI